MNTPSSFPPVLFFLFFPHAPCAPSPLSLPPFKNPKMFMRKYERIAASCAPAAAFAVITGDESKEARGMMMALAVRVTPTFFLWGAGAARVEGEVVGGGPPPSRTCTGVNENNLRDAVDAVLAGEGEEAKA